MLVNHFWNCATCGKPVQGCFEESDQSFDGSEAKIISNVVTPSSRYWKGSNFSEVYCSPECSYVGHKGISK